MFYVDSLKSYPKKRKKYCHLVSDISFRDLHEFVQGKLNIPRSRFHKNHYDLTEEERSLALTFNTKEVTSREIVCILKGLKNE